MLSYQELIGLLNQLGTGMRDVLTRLNKLEQDFAALQTETQALRQLRTDVETLQRQLAEADPDHPSGKGSRIERIDYHFEQLKIERLEGTLNIGLTPYTSGNIEQLASEGKVGENVSMDALAGEGFEQEFRIVRDRINQYLREEAPRYLDSLEQRYQVVLGQAYQASIIQDIDGQLDERIRYYLAQIMNGGAEPLDQTERLDEVYRRTVQDIRQAMEMYFQSLPRQRSEDG